MAAGCEPKAEFRFVIVERTEPGSARLRIRHRREPVDGGFAAGVGSAESFSIGALGGEPFGGWNCKPVGVRHTALLGRLGAESDGTIGKPADPEREHATVVSWSKHSAIVAKREHTAIESEREFAPVVAR